MAGIDEREPRQREEGAPAPEGESRGGGFSPSDAVSALAAARRGMVPTGRAAPERTPDPLKVERVPELPQQYLVDPKLGGEDPVRDGEGKVIGTAPSRMARAIQAHNDAVLKKHLGNLGQADQKIEVQEKAWSTSGHKAAWEAFKDIDWRTRGPVDRLVRAVVWRAPVGMAKWAVGEYAQGVEWVVKKAPWKVKLFPPVTAFTLAGLGAHVTFKAGEWLYRQVVGEELFDGGAHAYARHELAEAVKLAEPRLSKGLLVGNPTKINPGSRLMTVAALQPFRVAAEAVAVAALNVAEGVLEKDVKRAIDGIFPGGDSARGEKLSLMRRSWLKLLGRAYPGEVIDPETIARLVREQAPGSVGLERVIRDFQREHCAPQDRPLVVALAGLPPNQVALPGTNGRGHRPGTVAAVEPAGETNGRGDLVGDLGEVMRQVAEGEMDAEQAVTAIVSTLQRHSVRASQIQAELAAAKGPTARRAVTEKYADDTTKLRALELRQAIREAEADQAARNSNIETTLRDFLYGPPRGRFDGLMHQTAVALRNGLIRGGESNTLEVQWLLKALKAAEAAAQSDIVAARKRYFTAVEAFRKEGGRKHPTSYINAMGACGREARDKVIMAAVFPGLMRRINQFLGQADLVKGDLTTPEFLESLSGNQVLAEAIESCWENPEPVVSDPEGQKGQFSKVPLATTLSLLEDKPSAGLTENLEAALRWYAMFDSSPELLDFVHARRLAVQNAKTDWDVVGVLIENVLCSGCVPDHLPGLCAPNGVAHRLVNDTIDMFGMAVKRGIGDPTFQAGFGKGVSAAAQIFLREKATTNPEVAVSFLRKIVESIEGSRKFDDTKGSPFRLVEFVGDTYTLEMVKTAADLVLGKREKGKAGGQGEGGESGEETVEVPYTSSQLEAAGLVNRLIQKVTAAARRELNSQLTDPRVVFDPSAASLGLLEMLMELLPKGQALYLGPGERIYALGEKNWLEIVLAHSAALKGRPVSVLPLEGLTATCSANDPLLEIGLPGLPQDLPTRGRTLLAVVSTLMRQCVSRLEDRVDIRDIVGVTAKVLQRGQMLDTSAMPAARAVAIDAQARYAARATESAQSLAAETLHIRSTAQEIWSWAQDRATEWGVELPYLAGIYPEKPGSRGGTSSLPDSLVLFSSGAPALSPDMSAVQRAQLQRQLDVLWETAIEAKRQGLLGDPYYLQELQSAVAELKAQLQAR